MNFYHAVLEPRSKKIASDLKEQPWFLALWESGSKSYRRLAAQLVFEAMSKDSEMRKRARANDKRRKTPREEETST